jgi:hypothetical protein
MSITIGKAIYTILAGNAEISAIVADKIYPLVIPEDTLLPCICYERNSDVEYTRDGAGISSSSIDITVLSEKYDECIDITTAVFNALNMYSGTIEGHQIFNCRLSAVAETYAEDSYIQKLTFDLKSI